MWRNDAGFGGCDPTTVTVLKVQLDDSRVYVVQNCDRLSYMITFDLFANTIRAIGKYLILKLCGRMQRMIKS